MQKSLRFRLAIALILGMIASTAGAADHEMPELFSLSLEDLLQVKVTVASFFEQSDLNTASTADVITEEAWRRRGARRFSDAISHLPGAIVLPTWFSGESLTIRGYAQQEPTGVAMLWDGVPLATVRSGTAAFDHSNINLGVLDRIEVIRGPGSALYGTDAFHGVLSLKSFELTKATDRVSLLYGSDGHYQASIKHANKLGGGLWFNMALATGGQPDQGREFVFTDVVSGLPSTAEREYNYRSDTAVIKLLSEPDKKYSFKWGLYLDQQDAEGFPGTGNRFSGGASVLGPFDIGGNDSQLIMSKLSGSWRPSDRHALELTGWYWEKDGTLHTHLPSATGLQRVNASAQEDQYGANLTLRRPRGDSDSQWSADLGVRHQDVGSSHLRFFGADGAFLFEDVEDDSFNRQITSLAVEGERYLENDRWELHYGIRVDEYSDFGSHISPRLGVIYHARPNSSVKLLYGHAFRAPIAVNVAGTAITKGDPDIKPEDIDTLELVFMQQGATWKVEAVLFASKWTDAIIQVPSADPGFALEFANVGENSAHGVELSWQWHPSPWLVSASGSHIKSRDDHFDQDYLAFPEYILNLDIGYAFRRFDTTVYLSSRVHLDADEGPILGGAAPPSPLKDYWRTDLTVNRQLNEHSDVFLIIRNLMDRKNILPSINSSEGGIPDEPFGVSAGLRLRF